MVSDSRLTADACDPGDAKPQRDEFPNESTGCPHIDRNDSRCGHRFTLGRIEQAFAVCLGGFHGCPMFHRINGEIRRQRVTALSIAGHLIHAHGDSDHPADQRLCAASA